MRTPVKVKTRQVLAKRLADAVQAVRTRRMVCRDRFRLAVIPGDMVGAGEHHALRAAFARRLVEVVRTQDVRLQDRPERAFDRNATQVDDRVHPTHDAEHRFRIRQVGQHDLFAVVGRPGVDPIGQAQGVAVGRQRAAHGLAQPAGGAGQQQSFMHLDRHVFPRRGAARFTGWRGAAGHFPQLCYSLRQQSRCQSCVV